MAGIENLLLAIIMIILKLSIIFCVNSFILLVFYEKNNAKQTENLQVLSICLALLVFWGFNKVNYLKNLRMRPFSPTAQPFLLSV